MATVNIGIEASIKMEKEPMPPSYSEVFSTYQNPSAPLMHGNSPTHNVQPAMNSGWNPHANQHAVTAQPLVHQQPIQHQPYQQQTFQQQTFLQPMPQTLVIINQQIQLGDNPVTMLCPHCRQQTITRLEYETNLMTHVAAGVFCLLGWCPCALIPYCTNCLKDTVHNCSKCNGYIGTYRRTGNRRF